MAKRPSRYIDMTGTVVNDIAVVGISHIDSRRRATWHIVCTAGHEFTTRGDRIRKGTAKCIRCKSTVAVPSYSGLHRRVRIERGNASDWCCVDCGFPAKQWSLTREASETLRDHDGEYSLNHEDYAPRCISCHKTYDSEWR